MERRECWQCKGEGGGRLVPHPLRKKARHPVPWCSSQCAVCQEAVIECSDCAATFPDAWYAIGDIDEDWHYSAEGGYSLCQECVKSGEIACGCWNSGECDCGDETA
jgi:hypothetical protein